MWSETYGEATENEAAYSVIETSDGGYALAGTHLMVKTDALGNMLWNRTFPDGDIFSMVAASDGGYALAGNTRYGTTYDTPFDFWLVKTDTNGLVQWNRTYSKKTQNTASRLLATSDGGYALLGVSFSPNETESCVWLVKTDQEGNMQWNLTYPRNVISPYNITYPHGPLDIIQTSDGGYAMAGSATVDGDNLDFWLVKIDDGGNMLCDYKYDGGTEKDIASSIVQALDGGYILAGVKNYRFSIFTEQPPSVIWIVKTDAEGLIQWNKTYGEDRSYSIKPYSIIATSDGGYAFLTGDDWLIKTDALGNTEWTEQYEGRAKDLLATSDGGYAIAGDIFYPSIGSDFWLAKTNEFGIIPENFTLISISLFFAIVVPIVISKKRLLRKH